MPNGYISGEATKSFSKTSDEATRSNFDVFESPAGDARFQ
jgi:hypothetical protein